MPWLRKRALAIVRRLGVLSSSESCPSSNALFDQVDGEAEALSGPNVWADVRTINIEKNLRDGIELLKRRYPTYLDRQLGKAFSRP